jgi:hypothetical protein
MKFFIHLVAESEAGQHAQEIACLERKEHRLRSPRWNHCGCQPNQAKTFSPLLGLLNEHVSPERLYLETKWASLISFELAAEAALGDERVSFILKAAPGNGQHGHAPSPR